MNNLDKFYQVVCPYCGSRDFKQIVNESYFRFIDCEGKITGTDPDRQRDLGFGEIVCANCDENCTEGFEFIEIQ